MLRMASKSEPFPGVIAVVLLLLMRRNAISGRESASFVIKSLMRPPSVCVVLRNFLRAGVLKNRSSTWIVVPRLQPVSPMSCVTPPMMLTWVPSSSPSFRVRIRKRETAAIVGKASPRKPSVLKE